MKWKQFKKERISLNYTVMLLPHSQKKPIHFKTPVWTFGLIILALFVLSGACLFFAGSRHQLNVVRKEKEQLEKEWELLAAQKQLEDQENELLKQARQEQELALKELEQKTRDTLSELDLFYFFKISSRFRRNSLPSISPADFRLSSCSILSLRLDSA